MPDGTWLSVPPIENTLIVNIGDMLAFWSGGKYRSTLHKVSNRSGRTRHSLAFFYDPAYNTPLVNLRNDLAEQNEKGGVVQTALDHLLEKIGDSFSYQQK
jgi:isopenicillin N synthase-like dioxygenase